MTEANDQYEIDQSQPKLLTILDHTRPLLSVLPGLAFASLLAWFGIRLSKYVGEQILGFERTPISAVMVAILLGLLVGNLIRIPRWLNPGLSFSVKRVLRLGIVLLGIRLSLFAVFSLGLLGIPIVVVCIAGALILTRQFNARLDLPPRLGALIAVGTAICGVSAIVATAPTIDADDEEVAYAVAIITVFGIAATLIYPYLANWLFGGDAIKAGLFLGTSVHDTSQVTGAALVFADLFSLPRALDTATVTKLVRNVFMVIVTPLMAYLYARQTNASGNVDRQRVPISQLLPLFIFGFLAMAAVRSIGDAGISGGGSAFGLLDGETWAGIVTFVQSSAVTLLVVALAAVGLTTHFGSLKALGVKPFVVGFAAAITVGVISVATIAALGAFVAF